MVAEVDEPSACGVGDPTLADVPLRRHRPSRRPACRSAPRSPRAAVPRRRASTSRGRPLPVRLRRSGKRRSARAISLGPSLFGRRQPRSRRPGWRRGHGASCSFRQRERLGEPLGALASMPRRRMRPRKMSSSNQCLPAWLGKVPMQQLDLLVARRDSSSGTKTFGDPRSPSYFGISYSRIRWSRNVFQVSSQTSR